MHWFVILLALCAASWEARADTVLVLPFFNRTNSPDLDWIGESISESLTESLASEGILVLGRDDRLEAYRRLSLRPNALLTHASIIKVGEALDATRVIYGSYALKPPGAGESGRGSLRISARIINVRRMQQGPEFSEVAALDDLAGIETRLGWNALTSVSSHTPSQQEFLAARPAVRLDAVESYIRGLLSGNPEQQRRLFMQAARLDERFSEPCFQLGKIYWDKKDYKDAAGWLQRVRRADSHYFEAQFFLGLSKYYMGDYTGAAQAFEAVAAAVPLNEVYNDLGAAQDRLAQPAARENFRKALEGDDADPDYQFNMGYALWKSAKFNEAAASFRAALERNPNDAEASAFLARAEKQEGATPGDPRTGGRERLKTNYEETAYRQLKAELESKK